MGVILGGKNEPTFLANVSESEWKQIRAEASRRTGGIQLGVGGAQSNIPEYHPVRGSGLTRTAQGMDVSRVAPLFNDPRYTSSTLAIPTDERTLHGLYRFFIETDPIVGNAISMHCELPLAGLSLGPCKDPGIDNHFKEMWERIHAHQLLTGAVSEFFGIGEATLFGAWNEADFMWDRFAVLNPDYVKKDSTWVTETPLIRLVPDEALRKIVRGQSPRFLYDQIPDEVKDYVIRGQDIPLNPLNTFTISHAKAPYEVRGKSIIKRILKILMYEDKLQQAQYAIAQRHVVPLTVVKVGDPASGWLPSQTEIDSVREMFSGREIDPNFCYDEKTECLTDSGWKKYTELVYSDRIAAFDPATRGLRYDYPSLITVQDYDADMMKFSAWGTDMLVTPNHRMWIKRDEAWQIEHAETVRSTDKVRTNVESVESVQIPDTLTICGKTVNSLDWFEFAGWYLSEGSVDKYVTDISQSKLAGIALLEPLLKRLPWKFTKYRNSDSYVHNSVHFAKYITETFGKGAKNKRIPRWMILADREHLEKLLMSHRAGDGSTTSVKHDSFYIGTISQGLADDLQEIAFRLGWSVYVSSGKGVAEIKFGDKIYKPKNGAERYSDMYHVTVSKHQRSTTPGFADDGIHQKNWKPNFDDCPLKVAPPRKGKRVDWSKVDLPALVKWSRGGTSAIAKVLGCDSGSVINQMKKQRIVQLKYGERPLDGNPQPGNNNIQRVPYQGKIWCVSVPTGIIVTRRNGRIAIQGQTVFYHWGLDVQFYGSTGKVLPLDGEFNRVYRLKFIGLGISEAILSGQSSTYSSAFASLEVQRQRYLSLQLKLEALVHDGWFRPVADACGFYKTNKASSLHPGKSFGGVHETRNGYLKQFTGRNDYQDNIEFQMMLARKEDEWSREAQSLQKEFIFPKLDWGALSMAADDAYKQMLLKVKHDYPWLVSDNTIARVLKLDPREQAAEFLRDAGLQAWRQMFLNKIAQVTGVPVNTGAPGASPGGGGGSIIGSPAKPGGPPTLDLSGVAPPGGKPNPSAPVGAGGDLGGAAKGETPAPPAGAGPKASSLLEEDDLYRQEMATIESEMKQDFVQYSTESIDQLRKTGTSEADIQKIVKVLQE